MEVRELELKILVQEEILRLNITVNHVSRVDVRNSVLSRHQTNRWVGKGMGQFGLR